jgi:hypothetical protein
VTTKDNAGLAGLDARYKIDAWRVSQFSVMILLTNGRIT